jgi:hypothetical protein
MSTTHKKAHIWKGLQPPTEPSDGLVAWTHSGELTHPGLNRWVCVRTKRGAIRMKNAWDVSFLPAKGGIIPRLSTLLHPHIEGEAALYLPSGRVLVIRTPHPKMSIPISCQITHTQNSWVMSTGCGQTHWVTDHGDFSVREWAALERAAGSDSLD